MDSADRSPATSARMQSPPAATVRSTRALQSPLQCERENRVGKYYAAEESFLCGQLNFRAGQNPRLRADRFQLLPTGESQQIEMIGLIAGSRPFPIQNAHFIFRIGNHERSKQDI